VITLALQLVRHGIAAFPPREIGAALKSLHYDHPALHLLGETSGSGSINR